MAQINFFKQFKKGCTPLLIIISHSEMDEPLYLTDNNEDLEYDGQTYRQAFFKINLPEVTKDSMGNATIEIGCADQQLVQVIRSLSTPPKITFVATYLEDGVYSRLAGYEMNMSNFNWDVKKMQADLTLDLVLNNDFPSSSFTPFFYPGIA